MSKSPSTANLSARARPRSDEFPGADRLPDGVPIIQTAAMRARGLGWKALLCPNPNACEEGLCLEIDSGRRLHPVDPVAFAKWRVRANPDQIPAHVLITTEPEWIDA